MRTPDDYTTALNAAVDSLAGIGRTDLAMVSRAAADYAATVEKLRPTMISAVETARVGLAGLDLDKLAKQRASLESLPKALGISALAETLAQQKASTDAAKWNVGLDYAYRMPMRSRLENQLSRAEDRIASLEHDNRQMARQLRVHEVDVWAHGERITELEDRATETEDYIRDRDS